MATYADLLEESLRRQRRGGMEHTSDFADSQRRLRGTLNAIDQGAAGIAKLFPQMADSPEEVAYKTSQWMMPSAGLQDAKNLGKGALQAIGVWHGSPHKFDKFDLSKIGTGEGAQAYGHGIYTAEDRPIAEWYRDKLSEGLETHNLGIDGKQVPFLDAFKLARRYMDPEDYADFIATARDKRLTYGDQSFTRWLNNRAIERMNEAFDGVYNVTPDPGNLYKVSLQWPDPAREAADPMGPQHFLDWDLPLSQQPEHMRRALSPLADEAVRQEMATGYTSGGEAYEAARSLFPYDKDRVAVSDALARAGIPGIKYLDAGSRGAGNGSRNFVVFSDQIPKIQERNGISIADLMRR